MSFRRAFELATGRKLPKHMEARPMKRGGYSYRLLMPDGSRVPLGWNYEEALERYRELRASPSREEDVTALAKQIHDRHRKGAKARGIAFEIDRRAIWRLLMAQRMRCAVTGRQFTMDRIPGIRTRPYAPSLDRIRSDLPYTEENCRLVCFAVNRAISDLGDDTFMGLFQPLVERLVEDRIAEMRGNERPGRRANS